MKFLVTGGAGFIGSHTVDELVNLGHEVVVIDDLNDYYSKEIKLNNIQHNIDKVTFYEEDICNKSKINNIFKKERPQCVLHFAARAGVRPSIKDPELYLNVNINGTYNILESCKNYDVDKVVFASSSSVYGINKKTPFAESDTIYRTISPYAATKLAAEQICSNFSHLYDLSIVCLRFFTVYGPRQRPDLAIAKFFDLINNNQSIPRYGNGETGRDYTYIADIVQGIMQAVNYDKKKFDIFNLGESEPIELNDLIETISQVIGQEVKIKQLDPQPGDVPFTYADISKSKKYLGYNPKTNFKEGIANYYKWFKEQKENQKLISA